VSVLALSLSHVFLAALKSFGGLHLLDMGAHLHSLNGLCLLASLHAITSVDALNVFIGLNILDGLARFGALNALARLAFLHATTGLHTVHALFARLNALYRFARFNPVGSKN
jgi:hypothetical protein